MLGFKEFLKNERKNKTVELIKNIFSSIFNKKNWLYVSFWFFLILTLGLFYQTLTFDNKFPVNCGKIIQFEKTKYISEGKENFNYKFFVQTPKNIEEIDIKQEIYEKYEASYNTNNKIDYCDSYTNKAYVFFIFLTIISFIITIVYLIRYSSEN